MNLFSWNIRGLGNPAKLGEIKKITNDKKPALVRLTETKPLDCSIHINCIWDNHNFGFVTCNVVSSHIGGLILMWNN